MRRYSDTLFLIWLSVLLMLGAFPAQALTCKTTSSAISEVVDIEKILKVSSSELIANKKIWVSSPITATFTCEDTDNYPDGESAYFWLDPENKASSLPNFIQIGITYNGVDYLLQNKTSVEIGPATLCNKSGDTCQSPALSQTFSLVYQVYIVSTGRSVTGNGKIADNLKLSLFQVDGKLGLRNGTAGANYNLFITGLNRITTMACVPTVTISPGEIDFGNIPAGNARPGYYEKTRPFTVKYGLVKQGSGTNCATEALLATFSSTNTVQESAIILPRPDSGFGIVISPNANMLPRIEMNTPIRFTLATGSTLSSTYTAGLLWLSRTPKLGTFSATARITVTFE